MDAAVRRAPGAVRYPRGTAARGEGRGPATGGDDPGLPHGVARTSETGAQWAGI